MTARRFEVRELNGRHGVWDRYALRWEELDGGGDEMDEYDAEVLVRDLNASLPAGTGESS